MKTLSNHIILYDAECPMCKMYTNAFTQTGMLDVNGRASYQNMPHAVCPMVDMQRAVNEIALVNTETGRVYYGVDSVFKIIGNSFPVFKPVFNFAPFLWFMRKVYAFISYNRRVIIPASNSENSTIQPAFKLKYRIAFLLLTWLAVGGILTLYAHHLTQFVPIGNPLREFYICGGQVVFQGIVISIYMPVKRWEYLGNMMTISFAGALLLMPVLLLAQFIALNAIICTLCFLAVAGLMFLEHIRRAKLLHLGWLLTVTWVVYRLLILAVILI
ncbi:DCC1-like thiol-disulfide oxidoreductase family protein [Mucilaginibacter glaciei]|uniref:DUF393 domain-containing protein n=1 Tax=Mucilaginibacter glaciei TaxID=2772109 RepID=A0A926NGZ4_9SPHI|nr:DCC1-like thiol-disulfide oxidoreductase family protein [Mucilaginibacter glaciei]MBD1391904.1 DUF393 domain-containing protein [Mucilaginibacter glaciei]